MNVGEFVFGLLVFVPGVIFLIVFVVDGFRLRRWVELKATITNSKIERSNENQRVLLVLISFAYDFKYRSYTSENRRIYETARMKKASEKLSEYAVGKQLTVYCNPQKPTENMTKKDIGTRRILFWGITFYTLIGLVFIVLSFFTETKDYDLTTIFIINPISNHIHQLWFVF